MNNIEERPAGWSHRANAPYFKAHHALEIKKIFDDMILAAESGDKEPRVIKYADSPEISHVTLYLKINQSIFYLLERMDDTGLYKNFRKLIHISRIRSIGIKFSFIAGLDDKPLEAYKISSPEVPKPTERVFVESQKPSITEDWKATLHAFIEKAVAGQNFKLKNLSLTKPDGAYIDGVIKDDMCIIYKATAETLFVAKLTPEEFAKVKE